MDIEEAIRIARLWRAGKMIGYGEDGEELVRDALLAEVERLRSAVEPVAPQCTCKPVEDQKHFRGARVAIPDPNCPMHAQNRGESQ